MLIDQKKIDKAKEKLGDKNAEIMAEIFCVEKWDSKNKKGCCPFHAENTPSFIYNSKNYKFHCFGCNKNVDILDAFIYQGKTYAEAAEKLFELAGIEYSFGELGVQTSPKYRYPKLEPVCNNKEHVYSYLGLRGISRQTVDYAQVGEDAHGNCVFNYYDTNNVLCLVKYRPSHKINKEAGEAKCWVQKDTDSMPLLFNMNKINVSSPLLITEGEGDTLAAIESGFTNAVSVPFGSQNLHWIEENFEWLEQFESIIICSDNDEAGIKMRKEAIPRLGTWRTKYVDIPKVVVSQKTNDKVAVKDLNEVLYHCGKQAVLDLIYNAQDSEVTSVTNISEIEDIDLEDIDGVETGIKELDKELLRLFYSTLTVVSGKPGAGKTSFLSQLACQALDQGVNVMMFSRELPAYLQRSWIHTVMAGPSNVIAYESDKGGKYYKVTNDAKSKINSTYDKRWFLYNDDASNKLDDILMTMEGCLRKYSTRLIILDNLMTIDVQGTAENELQKQTECITRLIEFAAKWQAAIVLVCHPRKMDAQSDVGIYDVAGTSNIINLAHRTFGLRRIDHETENDPHDVVLTMIKDRLYGNANKKIYMYYDTPSRRFYSNEEEYNHHYKWETENLRNLPYPHPDESEVFGAENKDEKNKENKERMAGAAAKAESHTINYGRIGQYGQR